MRRLRPNPERLTASSGNLTPLGDKGSAAAAARPTLLASRRSNQFLESPSPESLPARPARSASFSSCCRDARSASTTPGRPRRADTRATSSSITCAVCSLNCRGSGISRPRNGCSSPVAEAHRAEPLAHAPVRHHAPGEAAWPASGRSRRPAVNSSKTSFSAARPPSRNARRSCSSALADVHAVFLGQQSAWRPASGRGE